MASSTTNSKDQKPSSNDDKVPAAPLVLVSNSWLEDLTSRTRAKPIPWEGYHRADLVSAEELKMIKKVDRQPKSKIDQIIDQVGYRTHRRVAVVAMLLKLCSLARDSGWIAINYGLLRTPNP